MIHPPSPAYTLFVEHYDQLLALVHRRLAVVWQYRPQPPEAALGEEIQDYVNEFGRLLRVVLRYHLTAALRQEASWYASMLASRGPGQEALALLVDSWLVALQGILKPPECNILAQPLQELRAELATIVAQGQERLHTLPTPAVAQLVELLIAGDWRGALGEIRADLSLGQLAYDIILAKLLPAMAEIGRRWERNELAIYQEHLATETVLRLLASLPAWFAAAPPVGRSALVTCVPGEEHQVLPLALGMYLELRGWRVWSLGRSLPRAQIAAAVTAFKPDVVFLSLTMLSRLEEALAAAAQVQSCQPAPTIFMGGRGTIAAQQVLAAAGIEVVQDFAQAHSRALGGTHA